MSAADALLDAKPGADQAPAPVAQPQPVNAVSSPADAILDSPPQSESDQAQEAAGKPVEGEWGKLAALKIKTAGQLAWNLAWKPTLHVPEAPKNLPDLRYLGPDNPAVLGAVYNGAVKPFFESASSPGGVATLATSLAGGAEFRAGKMALKGISGLFGGIMAKDAYDQFGAEKKLRADPASSLQDVVESYARQATTQLMAVAGLTGAILPESGGIVKPGDLKGTPGEVANKIRSKIPEAPLDQVDKMKAAADKLDSLHTKQSDMAQAWDEVKQVLPRPAGARAPERKAKN